MSPRIGGGGGSGAFPELCRVRSAHLFVFCSVAPPKDSRSEVDFPYFKAALFGDRRDQDVLGGHGLHERSDAGSSRELGGRRQDRPVDLGDISLDDVLAPSEVSVYPSAVSCAADDLDRGDGFHVRAESCGAVGVVLGASGAVARTLHEMLWWASLLCRLPRGCSGQTARELARR